jgi:hypothetical protein
MNKYLINDSDIFELEPVLKNYLPEDEVDYSGQLKQAEYRIISDLKSQLKEVKKTFIPLEITTESVEDTIERLILIADVSSHSSGVIKVLGSSDNTTFVEVARLSFTENKKYREIITSPYKYYKYEVVSGTPVFDLYLYEFSYYNAVLYYALSIIYQGLVSSPDDRFSQKSDYFLIQYQNMIQNLVSSYEVDGTVQMTVEAVRLVR